MAAADCLVIARRSAALRSHTHDCARPFTKVCLNCSAGIFRYSLTAIRSSPRCFVALVHHRTHPISSSLVPTPTTNLPKGSSSSGPRIPRIQVAEDHGIVEDHRPSRFFVRSCCRSCAPRWRRHQRVASPITSRQDQPPLRSDARPWPPGTSAAAARLSPPSLVSLGLCQHRSVVRRMPSESSRNRSRVHTLALSASVHPPAKHIVHIHTREMDASSR